MRAVLIRPVYHPPTYDPEIQEALGIEILASVLRAEGHDCLLLDPMLSGDSEASAARTAAAYKPNVIGFSAMSEGDLGSIRRLWAMIEGPLSETPVAVVGGTLPSTQPAETMRHLPGSFLGVRFEGEGPLCELLSRIRMGSSIRDVPGIVFRDKDGTIQETPPPAPLECLDALPDADRTHAGVLVEQGRTLNIQGSRGCCGNCAYCCAPAFPRHAGTPWRGRSPERIAVEVARLNREFGARTFNVVDDDFLGPLDESLDRAERFRDALRSQGLTIAFGIQARPDSLFPDVIRALGEAGLAYAFVGVESDDPVQLKSWRRNQDSRSAFEAIARLEALGIAVQIGFILFHPQVTLADLKSQASMLSRHGVLNYRTATNRLHALPGSAIHLDHLIAGRTSKGEFGGFTPPMPGSGMEKLYEGLLLALQPVRPCWVHGMSQLPSLITLDKVRRERGSGPRALPVLALRGIMRALDAAVEKTLFALIDGLESGRDIVEEAQRLRFHNLYLAEQAAKDLADQGLAESKDQLRQVVLAESGL